MWQGMIVQKSCQLKCKGGRGGLKIEALFSTCKQLGYEVEMLTIEIQGHGFNIRVKDNMAWNPQLHSV